MYEALKSLEWFASMNKEFHELVDNNTWELVLAPSNAKTIGNKSVFQVKLKVHRSLERYKSKVVEIQSYC